jgi:transcriptional regulator with XRE-family HTH domain
MGCELLVRFGMRVRQRRLELGLSQENLSLSCGLDRSYIGSVERGRRNVSLVNITKIAKALGLDARDLL